MFLAGFITVLTNPVTMAIMVACVIVGIIFGAIPGLSATGLVKKSAVNKLEIF